MPEHPNAALVRRGFAAFRQGDLATLQELFAPEVVWHSPGSNPASGDYRGLEAVLAYMAHFGPSGASGLTLDLHDVTASDGHAVALIIDRGEVDGAPVTSQGGIVFNLTDGRVQEAWAFNYEQERYDSYWRDDSGS